MTKAAGADEAAVVERLRKMAGAKSHGELTLGIGDDCAIFRPTSGEELLFTIDQMIEDVHFERGQAPSITGHRALGRSLSDIAAMGGEPRFCLVTLAMPVDVGMEWIEAFYGGLLRLARRTSTTLAGGDLARDPNRIHCDVMVCGAMRARKASRSSRAVTKAEKSAANESRAMRRDGARPGDLLYVSGRLGKPWDRLIEPRLKLGQSLVGLATACIDLSDGLSQDLHRLCLASGVAAEVDRIPIVRGSTLERALHGGEDYELLFTLPPGVGPPRAVTHIGSIVPGKTGTMRFQGQPLAAAGYDHFRKSK